MKRSLLISIVYVQLITPAFTQNKTATTDKGLQAKTVNGIIEGNHEKSGVYSFKGIPYAAPPVGDMRWKEPQPVKNWDGVRAAKDFGPRAMQAPIFGDMNFRSNGMSEDCLYLNVWTPNTKGKLPVLVYFYGGGFVAGDGSEPRYDGESMSQKGIVAITVNYRLGVFGFFAHPELTQESPHHSSSNYGLMDQSAALRWVKQNIAAFGGDPNKITIVGESAGSVSVSAQMASPLSKNLIAGAIGESGSLLGALPPVPLAQAEQNGLQFAKTIGANSLADLRALNADSLLNASTKYGPFRFSMTIDGYFFPKDPLAIFQAGEQAHVPLLVGWNSEEMNYRMVMGNDPLTKENFEKAVQKLYGDKAPDILKVYAVNADADVEQVATDLSSDRFIAFSTWRWADLQTKTGTKPVYRYYYSRPRPVMRPELGNVVPGLAGGVQKADNNTPKQPPAKGAVHSAEIEYAMGNLSSNKVYAWTADDYKVSKTMQQYFANFIKTGNPNSAGLPKWPATNSSNPAPVMHIDVNTRVVPDTYDKRHKVMEQNANSK
jgi:para-nitrobenzyl esterase